MSILGITYSRQGAVSGERSSSRASEEDEPASTDAVMAYAMKNPPPAEEECPICQDDIEDQLTLDKCGHSFCTACINTAFQYDKVCPMCMTRYGERRGNQPESGTMKSSHIQQSLPGYESHGTLVIDYNFPNGIQTVSNY